MQCNASYDHFSCIDHFVTNYSTSCSSGYKVSLNGDCKSFTSIYYLAYMIQIFSSFPDAIEFRDFCQFDSKIFETDLKMENQDSILTYCKDNESLTKFLHIFNGVST